MDNKEINENRTTHRRSPPCGMVNNKVPLNLNANENEANVASDGCCHSNTMIRFIFHRIIFGTIKFKLIVLFNIIIIGSILKSLNLSPDSYLSLKSNIFNQYFAKLGWGWTLSLLVPFIYLRRIRTHSHYQILTQHLTRLLVATGLWFITTKFFVHLEEATGSCKVDATVNLSRAACRKNGHDWQIGFDISGHTFLLVYSLLIINEEIKSYHKDKSKNNDSNVSPKSNDAQYKLFSIAIHTFYVLLALLTVLWEFMLLSTALYFHETSHKIIAAVISVLFWYLTYRVWYSPESSSILCPSSP